MFLSPDITILLRADFIPRLVPRVGEGGRGDGISIVGCGCPPRPPPNRSEAEPEEGKRSKGLGGSSSDEGGGEPRAQPEDMRVGERLLVGDDATSGLNAGRLASGDRDGLAARIEGVPSGLRDRERGPSGKVGAMFGRVSGVLAGVVSRCPPGVDTGESLARARGLSPCPAPTRTFGGGGSWWEGEGESRNADRVVCLSGERPPLPASLTFPNSASTASVPHKDPFHPPMGEAVGDGFHCSSASSSVNDTAALVTCEASGPIGVPLFDLDRASGGGEACERSDPRREGARLLAGEVAVDCGISPDTVNGASLAGKGEATSRVPGAE